MPVAKTQLSPARPRADLTAASGPHRFWHNNSLLIVLFALFGLTMAGQALSGWLEYNSERRDHKDPSVVFAAYMKTGHFWEATGENWESEFLQMAMFVVLTAVFRQKGSAESKRVGVVEEVDLDPERFRDDPEAPGPVRAGGWQLALYKRSLSLAFGALFFASVVMHAAGGWREFNEDRSDHGQAEVGVIEYLEAPRFWFESLQNWQSEFLSLAVMVGGSIYLRQHGSGESKPVHAPHSTTGR